LKIVFQLELLSARASPQLLEPDNLRTFVSSPLLDPSKPLAGMTKARRDQAWVKICEEIEKAVKALDPR
jgi:hypothetical protein